MPQLTDSQISEMDKTLEVLINICLKLTRINQEPDKEKCNESNQYEEISDTESSDDENAEKVKVESKYKHL